MFIHSQAADVRLAVHLGWPQSGLPGRLICARWSIQYIRPTASMAVLGRVESLV